MSPDIAAPPVTDRVRDVLEMAGEEAARRGQHQVETRDVLEAILVEGNGVACAVLRRLGVDPVELAAEVGRRPDGAPALEATPEAPASLLQGAAAEAAPLGHHYIGTEHLLIAIAREGGPAAEILLSRGVTAERAADAAGRLLGRQI